MPGRIVVSRRGRSRDPVVQSQVRSQHPLWRQSVKLGRQFTHADHPVFEMGVRAVAVRVPGDLV
jgi:hypothetical protein